MLKIIIDIQPVRLGNCSIFQSHLVMPETLEQIWYNPANHHKWSNLQTFYLAVCLPSQGSQQCQEFSSLLLHAEKIR